MDWFQGKLAGNHPFSMIQLFNHILFYPLKMVASGVLDLYISLLRWRSMTRELTIVALRRAAFCLEIHQQTKAATFAT